MLDRGTLSPPTSSLYALKDSLSPLMKLWLIEIGYRINISIFKLKISHIFFVNDLTLFFKEDPQSCYNFMSIFDTICYSSIYENNLSKSKVLFFIYSVTKTSSLAPSSLIFKPVALLKVLRIPYFPLYICS